MSVVDHSPASVGEVHAVPMSRAQRVLVEGAARRLLQDASASARVQAGAREALALCAAWQAAADHAAAEDVRASQRRLTAAAQTTSLDHQPVASLAAADS